MSAACRGASQSQCGPGFIVFAKQEGAHCATTGGNGHQYSFRLPGRVYSWLRPADVLSAQAQDIPTGMGQGAGRVALDIGIVCPQAASHLSDAAAEVLRDVARRCRDAGVTFQPLILKGLDLQDLPLGKK